MQLGPVLGFAIKMFDVDGTKLVEDEPDASTFDLVLKNNPIFVASTAKHYVVLQEVGNDSIKYLARGKTGYRELLTDLLTGRGTFAQADWACVLARTGDAPGARGMSLIIVPTTGHGFSVSRTLRKLGNHSSDTAELIFDNVRVPKAYTVGEEGMGFILQMRQFQRERLVGAILSYSSMEKVVRETIAYTQQRRAFGVALIEQQAIHFRLAELLTEIQALRALCYDATERFVAGEDITRLASMAKLKGGRLSREVTDSCLQYYGGMGYMEETPIARAYRDARLLSIGGGADEVMLGIIARQEGMLPPKPRQG